MEDYQAKVQKDGRITIPKPLREKLGLRSGDTLIVEIKEDRVHFLLPERSGESPE